MAVALVAARGSSRKSPSVTTEIVTPSTARAWLGRNKANRHISQRAVNNYARDMKAGHWRYTGDPIRFDVNGDLMDGQHRLEACVLSGVPFTTLVVRGLPIETRDVLDAGYKRNVRHTLHWMGHVSTTCLAAAAVALYRFRYAHQIRPTNREVIDTIERHKHLVDAVARISNQDPQSKRAIGPPPGLLAAMYYVGRYMLKEPERAETFVHVFENGQAAYRGDPAPLWRERILRERSRGIAIARDVHIRGLIHAWNGHAKRLRVEQFKLPDEVKIEGLDLRKI